MHPVEYSTMQAARALSVHVQTVKYHRHTTKRFAHLGKKTSKGMRYSQADVDEMAKLLAQAPSPGHVLKGDAMKNDERMAKAFELRESGQSLAEIMEALGYSSVQAVSRALASHTRKLKSTRRGR